MADFALLQKLLAAKQAASQPAPDQVWGGRANELQNELPPLPQAIPNLDKPMQQMELVPKQFIPSSQDASDAESAMKAKAAAERFKALTGRYPGQ